MKLFDLEVFVYAMSQVFSLFDYKWHKYIAEDIEVR